MSLINVESENGYLEAIEQNGIASSRGFFIKKEIPSLDIGLVSHYLLNNNYKDRMNVLHGFTTGTPEFTGYCLDAASGGVNIPLSSGVWCSYWEDTGTGFTFVTSSTIPLSFNDFRYSNLRIYDEVKTGNFLTGLFNEGYYPKDFMPIPTTLGLLAHYPLSGNVYDTTGNYDATEVGNTYTVDGEYGATSHFISTTVADHILCPAIPTASGDFTVCGWIKKTDDSDGLVINNRTSDIGNESEWQILFSSVSDTNLIFSLHNSLDVAVSVSFTGIPIVADDNWYWFCVEVSGNTINTYVNGTTINSTGTFTGTRNNGALNTTIGSAGWQNTTPTTGFDGNIKDIRLYNKVLTAQEKLDIYNYETNFRTLDINDKLLSYYPLDADSIDNYYKGLNGSNTDISFIGEGATLNGTTSIITLSKWNELGSLDDFSISLWLNSDLQVRTTTMVFSMLANYVFDIRIVNGLTNPTMNIAWQSGSTWYGTTFPIDLPLLEWVHCVAVFKYNTGIYLYVNGIEHFFSFTGAVKTYLAQTRIGNYGSSGTYYYKGGVMRLRAYEKALDIGEVTELYASERKEIRKEVLIDLDDITNIKNINADYSFANISVSDTINTLKSLNLLTDGDSIVVVKDSDDSLHEIIVSGAASIKESKVPVMTSYTLPEGQVLYSSNLSGWEAWKVFGAGIWSATYGASTNQYVGYHFISAQVINYVTITARNVLEAAPENISIQYSDDGTNWITLHNETLSAWTASETKSIGFENTTAHLYYRLYIHTSYRYANPYIQLDGVAFIYAYDSLDTTAISSGEIPTKAFLVEENITLNSTDLTISNTAFTLSGAILLGNRTFDDVLLGVAVDQIVTKAKMSAAGNKLTQLVFSYL